MPDRPTGQQLIGMTSNEILDIFGGADVDKYGQYIPGYNRTKESNARTDTQFSLKNILYESEQAQSKSGFAGGGAAGKASGEAREGTLQGFQKQLEGFYSDYESEVYGALAHLADLGAFEDNGGGSNIDIDPGGGGADPGGGYSGGYGQGDLYGLGDETRIPTSEQETNQTAPDPFARPTNPTQGQRYTGEDGQEWVWYSRYGWEKV